MLKQVLRLLWIILYLPSIVIVGLFYWFYLGRNEAYPLAIEFIFKKDFYDNFDFISNFYVHYFHLNAFDANFHLCIVLL